jgi:hypothetical protein
MNIPADAVEALAPYKVRTHNPSAHSDNRMHSDVVARAFGYRGALVPGVTVFSHLVRPLVAHFGLAWLERGLVEVGFPRPAYEGDLLLVRTVRTPGGEDEHALTVRCYTEDGAELANMTTVRPKTMPPPDPRGALPPAPALAQRPMVSWEAMVVGEPFPALAWKPTVADNREWCEAARDDLPIYAAGDAPPVHPGLCLRQANLVLRQRFTLPAWIHTASGIAIHGAPRVGSEYEVRAVPEEKWERKGHQFVRLLVAIRAGGDTLWDIRHTAIFRPCQAR